MRLRILMLWGVLMSQCLLTSKQDQEGQCLPLEEYGKPDPATPGKPAPTSDNLFQ